MAPSSIQLGVLSEASTTAAAAVDEEPTTRIENGSTTIVEGNVRIEALSSVDKLTDIGAHSIKVLSVPSISGRMDVEPEPGQHIGSGVFVADSDGDGSAVEYELDHFRRPHPMTQMGTVTSVSQTASPSQRTL